jgi:hypothetical protein
LQRGAGPAQEAFRTGGAKELSSNRPNIERPRPAGSPREDDLQGEE